MQQSRYKTDLRQRCYQFSLAVIKLTDKLPNKRSSWMVQDQMIRSATSIGANLVEGKAASSRLEFKRYSEISLKSAHETDYWLNLIRDSNMASADLVNPLVMELEEIISMLTVSVVNLKNNSNF